MPPVTNQMLNSRREENCISITVERKYYRVGQTWVKRSLRPTEWQVNPFTGTIVIPRFGRERLLNEAASMKFIAEHTNIPVPKLYCCFEDDEAVYLVMEYIEGVGMN
jgi:serine/threonine protein kinase